MIHYTLQPCNHAPPVTLQLESVGSLLLTSPNFQKQELQKGISNLLQ
jgi:hypothetical protein